MSLDEAIAALKTGDMSYSNLYWPLRKLGKVAVEPKRQNEVAALLDPVLLAENSTVRHNAQDVICAWGTKANFPTLLKLLEYQEYVDRKAAADALGALGGSKEAAKALADKLPNREYRLFARDALKKMGSYAEEAIWPYIGAPDDDVHDAACEVLGEVGSSKSLIKLRARRSEREFLRQRDVERAIEAMQKRLVKR